MFVLIRMVTFLLLIIKGDDVLAIEGDDVLVIKGEDVLINGSRDVRITFGLCDGF